MTAERKFADAHWWLDKSLDLSRRLGDREGAANCLNNMALLRYAEAADAEDYRVAYRLAHDGLRLLRELADHAGMAESLEIMSACAGKLGRAELGARGFGAAEVLRASVRNFHFPSQRETYRTMVADARVADARQRADQDIWESAWAVGAAQCDLVITESLDWSLPSTYNP